MRRVRRCVPASGVVRTQLVPGPRELVQDLPLVQVLRLRRPGSVLPDVLRVPASVTFHVA